MRADLNNAEIDELDELLQATPEPLEPLNVVMLDGYLSAVVVQPRLIPMEQVLPPVFDTEGRSLPPQPDAAWLSRCRDLIQRRLEAINRGLAEDRIFDPVVTDTEKAEPDEELQALEIGPHSRALLPWASGFLYACETFESLLEDSSDAVHLALSRILRHLPPQTDEEREITATLDREHPLSSESDAIDDVIAAVADLWDLTQKQRYAVPTLQREGAKVGRNDPCPCGSGKKYKQCCGKN